MYKLFIQQGILHLDKIAIFVFSYISKSFGKQRSVKGQNNWYYVVKIQCFLKECDNLKVHVCIIVSSVCSYVKK